MRRGQQNNFRQGWVILGLLVLVVSLGVLLLARLVFFDDSDAETDVAVVAKEQPASGVIAGRKNIYDRNCRELAVSFRLTSIYARPLELENVDAAASDISTLLKVDKARMESLLKTERSFVWLGRQLPAAQAEKILGLKIPGIYGVDEMHRFYPHKQLAASVLGFVKDGQGLAGIEFQYDNVLRGIAGRNADLANVGLSAQSGVEVKGSDLILSLDAEIQAKLEKKLSGVIRQSKAASGLAIVMDADSGAILAMASQPTYDPNSFWNFTAGERRNRAVVDPVFPGGLNRLFRAAADYELRGAVADLGGNSTGRWQLEKDGVYVSANLAKVADPVADDPIAHGLVNRLGLRAGTGIDLPAAQSEEGEPFFDVDEVADSTSAIKLLTAFARTLNGGVLVRPSLLAGVRSAAGERTVPGAEIDGRANFRPGFDAALGRVLAAKGREIIVESRVAEHLVESLSALPGKGDAVEVAQSSPDEKAAVAADTDDGRYYATMLGRSGAGKAKFVVVAALSGCRFNPEASSPLADLGRKILREAVIAAREIDGQPQPEPSANEDELYAAWLKHRKQPDARRSSTPVRAVGVMPDVSGCSLRKALQVLQATGLPVRVQGSGMVVSQQPAASVSLEGVQEVVVNLQLVQ